MKSPSPQRHQPPPRPPRWHRWLLAGLLSLLPATAAAQADIPGPAPAEPVLATLTNSTQINRFGMARARLNPHPVRLQGVVTLVPRGYAGWMYVHDADGGVLVTATNLAVQARHGDLVEVEGTLGVGQFHTFVEKARARILGRAPMPTPRKTPAERLLAGADFAQWNRLRFVVRDIARTPGTILLQGFAGSRPFYVVLEGLRSDPLPVDWWNAELEVDGVVWTMTDRVNKPFSFRMFVPDTRLIRVIQPGTTNPFARPLTTSRRLRESTAPGAGPVAVQGVVMHALTNADSFVLHDGTGPVRVQLATSIRASGIISPAMLQDPAFESIRPAALPTLQPGDRVEVVGTPLEDNLLAPTLVTSDVRSTGRASMPAPRRISAADGLLPANDGELVSLKARFIDRASSTVSGQPVIQFWLQSEDLIFEASLASGRPVLPELENNRLVEVTGVCSPVLGDRRRPRGLRVLLRDAGDIQESDDQPWLSPRTTRIVAVAIGVIAAALAWAGLLRRQVWQRTAQLQTTNADLQAKIAEHQRTEAALAESEARYRTMTEHAPEAIVVLDAATTCLTAANENAARLFGVPSRELIGRRPAELSPEFQPDGRPSATAGRTWLERAIDGEAPVFDWVHRHASGRLIPCEVRLVRLPAQDRVLLRGSITDNSERQRREQVQRATYEISEAVHTAGDLKSLYRRIHEIIRGLMPADNFFLLLHDPVSDQHVYVYHVDQMDAWPGPRRVTGGLVGYILRTSRSLLVDRDSMTDQRQEWHMVAGTPSAVWLGVPLIVRGVTIGVMALQDYHNPKAYGEEEKQLLGYIATQTALTIDRKRADAALAEGEARFRALFEGTSAPVAAYAEDGTVVFLNQAARRLFGLDPNEAWVGRPAPDFMWVSRTRSTGNGPQDSPTSRAIATGSAQYEWTVRRPDGSESLVEIVLTPILIDGRRVFQAVLMDISVRKSAELELERALGRERELSALKSNFVSLVSHEFRTPLGITMSAVELLRNYRDRLPPAKWAELLDDIFNATVRMAGLMEQVLVLGRVEAGRIGCQPVLLDLAGLAGRLVDETLSATAHRCPVGLTVDGDLSGARADEGLVRHIVSNLLSNAVKYSEPGRPVELRLRRDGDEVIITVQDQGMGIPEEDQSRLFRAFHRGGNVGQIAGTGLGLLIVRQCVDLHGGQISFRSGTDTGTTFTVRLPVFRAPAPEGDQGTAEGATDGP